MVSTKALPSSAIPAKQLRSPRSPHSPKSPRTKHTDAFAPLSEVLTDSPSDVAMEPDASAGVGVSPAEPYLLRRVLSGGSNASTLPSNAGSPGMKSAPLSPSSQGARTPKAGKAQQLASDMDGLNVRSPVSNDGSLPPPAGAPDIPEPMNSRKGPKSIDDTKNGGSSDGVEQGPISGDTNGHHTKQRSYTGSTDSSNSQHPVPSPHLGSSYGPEGFPILHHSPEASPMPYSPYLAGAGASYFGGNGNFDPELAARQAALLAKADEAVRQLNNTATVFQGPMPPGPAYPETFGQVPRNYANFVTPHQNPTVTRQSSTSSSLTDAASTSSEESDWCIPTVEWVPANQWQHSTYLNSPGTVFNRQEKDRVPSNSRMPPPLGTRPTSSRHPSTGPAEHPPLQHQNPLPFRSSAATPPLNTSHPSWATAPASESPDEDDDNQTVGHARDRSPSTSSQSAQSGLDLLWRAAHGIKQPNMPRDVSFDHKGKRKAGAEAVDKWRASGIPTGPPPPVGASQDEVKPPTTSPPRKRRRSEVEMEEMEMDNAANVEAEEDEEAIAEDPTSDYRSPSTSEGPVSDHDSEYGSGARRGRPIARGRGRGRAGTSARGRGGTTNTALSSAPGGITKQGTIKKVRKVGDSPNGTAKGGRKPAAVPPGGVQCDYVNPLPPYNRCTDVFTRKYDLPRHMARHARREGELVMEGKLSEDKAILWKTIKDKPKVVCDTCGESFTRMDALKRHQAKQHH
ncbi:hypothetical protein CNBH1850 [Cryptococcus deneoformans B-3501A]|uniref:hypothetical protein n=1 Tax=Cryptococcus deneoformans (strain B-3501A) TaxID=283643 RepID=UPI000042C21B|nr:hypothetical protein CNBH1850 [Cryptococcus neoformans var. neoformans B-3501A]EAL19083.1 hypothetical protein CNBH1850 [Cryptococcus neoformans var. neoformans B-3501A]